MITPRPEPVATLPQVSPVYFVRSGGNGQIGRFAAEAATTFVRGHHVVVETARGLDLGEVMGVAVWSGGEPAGDGSAVSARIVRAATPDDIVTARRHRDVLAERYAACERVFQEGTWPIRLLDVEIQLDGRLVLQYLGPHGLDTTGMRAWLREQLALDVVFEPIGRDGDGLDADPTDSGEGGCGAGCGRQACGQTAGADEPVGNGGGCGGHDGCSSCGLKGLVRRKQPQV